MPMLSYSTSSKHTSQRVAAKLDNERVACLFQADTSACVLVPFGMLPREDLSALLLKSSDQVERVKREPPMPRDKGLGVEVNVRRATSGKHSPLPLCPNCTVYIEPDSLAIDHGSQCADSPPKSRMRAPAKVIDNHALIRLEISLLLCDWPVDVRPRWSSEVVDGHCYGQLCPHVWELDRNATAC